MALIKYISANSCWLSRCLNKATKCLTAETTHFSTAAGSSLSLKETLATLIPQEQNKVAEFRKKYGKQVVDRVIVEQMYAGMRGIKGLICETSLLDPETGIHFRGFSIPECREKLPKVKGGEEPLPEGLFWLLCTGKIPTEDQAKSVSKEWASRADLPRHVVTLLNNFPHTVHPMVQFCAAITACNTDSIFKQAYSDGLHKARYWEYIYEDAMNLIARLPVIASIIYRNLYKDGSSVESVDPNKDWTANFASMLGVEEAAFVEMLRIYFVLHSDNEGGNVSAHTCNLVGSALSDPYLSFAAAMCGLAGPLHGLANQEVLMFLRKVLKNVGHDYTEKKLRDYVWCHLRSGQIVPGYGHAVLRKVDPRYVCLQEFAHRHLPNDPLFNLSSDLCKIVPSILLEHGKTKNPWPNVDALSGVLLSHYGLTQPNYCTVFVGVSIALGCMSQLIWSRALGLPLERPKSLTTNKLMEIFEKPGTEIPEE